MARSLRTSGSRPAWRPPCSELGLLEAVPDESLLALADEDDRDGDGVSGRPNRVGRADGAGPALGRFGWKAGQATVEAQVGDGVRE